MVLKFLALAGLAYIAWMATQQPPSGGVTSVRPIDDPEIIAKIANIKPYISDYGAHLANEDNWYVDSLGNKRFRGGL